eukprot:2392762-Rhodomonas_salina.1
MKVDWEQEANDRSRKQWREQYQGPLAEIESCAIEVLSCLGTWRVCNNEDICHDAGHGDLRCCPAPH